MAYERSSVQTLDLINLRPFMRLTYHQNRL